MATSITSKKGTKTTEAICRGISGKIIPGLCITNLSWTEGESSEKESRCSGMKEAMTRYGVYQEVTGDAIVRKSWQGACFVKGNFIQFTDVDVDAHYIKLMSTTDSAGTAKVTDFYEVMSTSTTKQTEEDWTISFTLRRDPDFQP